MIEQKPGHIEPSILEEAARWQVVLTSGEATDADIERHMEWLLEDPVHLLAEEHVAATMKATTELEAAARAMFAEDFIIDQPSAGANQPSFWEKLLSVFDMPRYAAVAVLVAAVLLVTVVSNVSLNTELGGNERYIAGDDVKIVSLSDGSRVSLVAGSAISATFDDDARNIVLEHGRAFFDVVSDVSRPFYVNTGLRQVKVVGTRFEVLRTEAYERVAVNEGLVSVSELNAPQDEETPEALMVEPGLVVEYNAGDEAPKISRRDADKIGAWSDGVLIFKSNPLSEVIVSINDLFLERKLVLADEKLATVPFSGTLVVSSPEQMARQLGQFLSLDVQVNERDIRLASK